MFGAVCGDYIARCIFHGVRAVCVSAGADTLCADIRTAVMRAGKICRMGGGQTVFGGAAAKGIRRDFLRLSGMRSGDVAKENLQYAVSYRKTIRNRRISYDIFRFRVAFYPVLPV